MTHHEEAQVFVDNNDHLSKQYSSLKPFHESSECGELGKTVNLQKSHEFEAGGARA